MYWYAVVYYACYYKIRKVLTKIGKESNCEELNGWIRACENGVLLQFHMVMVK